LTIRISGLPQLTSEVLFIDHEHVDAPTSKLGKPVALVSWGRPERAIGGKPLLARSGWTPA
jgi:hypothetical protein